MQHDPRLGKRLTGALAGRHDRRSILKTGGALGLGAPLLGGLAGGTMTARAAARAQDGGSLNLASYSSDPEPRAFMEQTVELFAEESGIDVELNTVNHEDFKQAIRTYLASDDPPDVLTWFAGNRMRFFVERGLIMPVTELFEEQGWTESFPEGILAVAQGSDGEYYFVPTNYYWWAMNYRPSVFQQAGIEGTPETFDDLLAVVEALKGIGVTPITIGTNAPWTAAAWFDYLNMRTNGPEFHIGLMDGQQAYNSPEVKETFANWRRLLDAQAFNEQPEALTWQDAVTPMYNGEAAMYLMGGFITDSYPDDGEADLDFFRFPMINDVPIGEDAPTDGFFVSAQASNVEPAMEFLAYVGGPDNQALAAEELGRIAVNGEVPADLYDARTQKGLELLRGADYIAQFYDRDTPPEMAELGMAAFIEFWNDPDAIDDILDGLEAEKVRIFEEAAASEG